MVRLKLAAALAAVGSFCCLNSSMVRLKLMNVVSLPSKCASFNSSMVRLKLLPGQKYATITKVSIPLWCD